MTDRSTCIAGARADVVIVSWAEAEAAAERMGRVGDGWRPTLPAEVKEWGDGGPAGDRLPPPPAVSLSPPACSLLPAGIDYCSKLLLWGETARIIAVVGWGEVKGKKEKRRWPERRENKGAVWRRIIGAMEQGLLASPGKN